MNKSKLHKSDGISPLNQWEMCHLLQEGQNSTPKMQATALPVCMGITQLTASRHVHTCRMKLYTLDIFLSNF